MYEQVEELVDLESDPGLMGDLEVQVDPLVEQKLESEPGRQVIFFLITSKVC